MTYFHIEKINEATYRVATYVGQTELSELLRMLDQPGHAFCAQVFEHGHMTMKVIKTGGAT